MSLFYTTTDPLLMAAGLDEVIYQNFKKRMWYMNKVVTERQTVGKQNYANFYRAYGIKNVPKRAEGDLFAMGDVSTGPLNTMYVENYGYALGWTKEMEEDDMYDILKEFPGWLTEAAYYTYEIIGHAPLNEGFTTNGYDGKPLFSTEHPAINFETRSNRPSVDADLNYTTLTDALVALMAQTDYTGHPIPFDPAKAVLSYNPVQDPMVKKILLTTNEPFTADNTINYTKGCVQTNSDPFITDTNQWTITNKDKNSLIMLVKKGVTSDVYEDKTNLTTQIRVRFRVTSGWNDYINTYGSSGST